MPSPYLLQESHFGKSELTDKSSLNLTVNAPIAVQRGRIELIMGCMFAGKTTELIRRCRKHEITGKRVLRVKFSADRRYAGEFKISTHSGQTMEAHPVTELAELRDLWTDYQVIGIDEGQFFTDIVEFSEKAANSGKIVIVSSLQGTFLRGSFPNILTLLPKCEKIKKLSAICKLCKENASFTFRQAGNDSKRMIGGADMYMPLCRECHARESNINKENAFVGDPSIVKLEIENKEDSPVALERKQNSQSMETMTDSSNTSAGDENKWSPDAKGFSTDALETDNTISLRQQN